MIKRFFFTYGTSPDYPFRGGWTEVRALNFKQAVGIFKAHHPCTHGNVLNCADYYTEEEFEKHKFPYSGNLGNSCHEVLCSIADPIPLFEHDLLELSQSLNSISNAEMKYRFNSFCGEVNFAAEIGLISIKQRSSFTSAAKAIIKIYEEVVMCDRVTQISSQ